MIRASRVKTVYPFLRDEESLANVALRETGAGMPWNPTAHVLELTNREAGTPIRLDYRVAPNPLGPRQRALGGWAGKLYLVLVARCIATRMVVAQKRWALDSTPLDDEGVIEIASDEVRSRLQVCFMICLGSANNRT